MDTPGDERTRLNALLRLVIERQPVAAQGIDGPADPSGTDAAQPLAGLSAERLGALTSFAAQPSLNGTGSVSVVDLLALRLLLDEYTMAVGRVRGVAVETAQALDRVRKTIRAVQEVQKDFGITPGSQVPQGS